MKINTQKTAMNIALSYEDNGDAVSQLAYLLEFGCVGLYYMTQASLERYIVEDCAMDKEGTIVLEGGK